MKALRYAKRLIEFNSTSHRSNRTIAKYLEMKLTKHGFIVEKTGYLDSQGVRKVNLVAKKGNGTGGLAYFCHSDVVPAKRWFTKKFGPFEPRIGRERLYGRGACDMKGSIGCMLAASQEIAWDDLNHPLYFVCTADEEVGFQGAKVVVAESKYYREMVRHQPKVIIGEPTMLEIYHGHKGCYEFTATAQGTAVHSSSQDGESADLKLIPFLTAMKELHAVTERSKAYHNPAFNPPTLSLNISIAGDGSANNVTSAKAVCSVNFRPMPGVDHQPIVNQVKELAQRGDLELVLNDYSGPMWVDPGSEFVEEALRLVHKKKSKTAAFGTDGGVLNELHEKIICGPGSIAQAHTKNEWVGLEQLHIGTEVYGKMIRHWCG